MTPKLAKIIREIDKTYHDEYDCDWCEERGYTQCSRGRYTILEEEFSSTLSDNEYLEVLDTLTGLERKDQSY